MRTRYGRSVRQAEQADVFAWMNTLSDLLLLLCTFFVLKLSMSTLETETSREKLVQLQGSLFPMRSQASNVSEILVTDAKQGQEAVSSDAAVADALNKIAAEEAVPGSGGGLGANRSSMNVTTEGGEIRIELGSRVFSSGTEEFSFYGERILSALAATLRSKELDLGIYLHTGTLDQSEDDPRSPWSFSRARSMAVLRQLIDAGVDPQTISLMAYPPNLLKYEGPNSEDAHLTSRLLIIVTMKAK